MATNTSNRAAIKQLVVTLLLLALLAGLAVAYYLMSRPPALNGGKGKDRNFLFSIYGYEGDLLRRPTGVGVAPNGDIYVADTGKKRIVVFNSDGDHVTTYGDQGKEKNQLWAPIDVAIASDGRSYVVDKTLKKMVVYDATKRPTSEITFPEFPLSIFLKDDLLFVTTESGVLIGNLDGKLLTGYVARGKKPGQFDRPAGVVVGKDGTLYVADSLNYRVQALSTKGKPVWQYGQPIPAKNAVMYKGKDRKFGLPSSITMDENDRLYVVDGLNSEIVVLDSKGEFMEKIGDVGHEDGRFYYPDGIEYSNGRLVVADKFNDRVSVFSVPLPPGEEWRAYVPYSALLLLLLPLLLIPMMRRGRRFIAAPDLVDSLTGDENAEIAAAAMKRVHAAPAVATRGAELKDLKLNWQVTDVDEASIRDLVERFALAEDQAASLAVALKLRGKKVLVTDAPALREAAAKVDVPLVSYAEIRALMAKQTPAVAEGGE